MKLVVMIPAYNEQDTIASVISEIPSKIPGIKKIQTLVIDDGSTDNTVKIAKKNGAIVTSHKKNRGVGAAFSTGIEKALEIGANIIVNIDADGQFDPKQIKKLIKPIIDKNADFVIGSRFLNRKTPPGMTLTKKIGNKFFTKMISKFSGEKLTDTQCGYRAFTKEVALKIKLFGKFTYTQEFLLSAAKEGFKIKEIPIDVGKRKNGKSRVVKSWYDYGLRALKIIFRNYCDSKPLTVFGSISIVLFLASLIPFTNVLIYYLENHQFTGVVGSGLLAGFLFLTSILVFTLGILADMFKRQRKIQEEILYYNKLKLYSGEKKIKN